MYVFYSHFAGRGFKNISESKYTKGMIFKQQLQEVEDGLPSNFTKTWVQKADL